MEKRRLVRKSEFDSLWKQGRRKALASWLQLVYRKNDLGHFRFGVSLSRKTGSSVVRNKLKRWTREILRSEIKTKDELGGWDIHYIFRAPKADFFKELTFSEYEAAVHQSLEFIKSLSSTGTPGSRPGHRMDLSSSSLSLARRSVPVHS